MGVGPNRKKVVVQSGSYMGGSQLSVEKYCVVG